MTVRTSFHHLAPPADAPPGGAALAEQVQAAALAASADLAGTVEHVSVHADDGGLALVLFGPEDGAPADVRALVAAVQARSGLLAGWLVRE